MRMMLVTGATGSIGRAMVAQALAEGWSVRGMARSQVPTWWPREAEYVQADVCDEAAVARAALGSGAIVHLATPAHVNALAIGRGLLEQVTVTGTANVATAAASVHARFLLVSSIAVYGSPPPALCDETTPTRAESPYGLAKLAAEHEALSRHPGPIILRCAVVYGPGDRGNVGRLMRAIGNGRGFVIGNGENRKSVLFAGNLADRAVQVLGTASPGRVWCVADAPPVTQKELAGEIALALGRRAPLSVPIGLAGMGARALDALGTARGSKQLRWQSAIRTLTSTTEVDGSAIDELLRYRPRVTLRAGIRQTVRWLREESGLETAARP